ncbi:MAG: exosortase H [Planctomycetota bacterium]
MLVFAGVMLLYYAVTALPWFASTVFPAYLNLNASVSAGILSLLGEEAHASGDIVQTPRFAVAIRRGCDALEPSALFVAAVLALPVAWRKRAPALLIGVPALLLLNLVRIISLYYVGVHFHDAFETVHIDVWQPLFIFLTVALWIGWALWATRRPAAETPPSGE